ncbi:hypothetical protein [Pedobacter cryoconitis]|uniref:hypothetical protein n=1 Tax=Pedobacter cryoconitis TaxID=188932 RepID=UPI001610D937|nr:hypothetical protein [Pedobacter cryoconitis]MBB5648931.1 hypothetical protein [Pedobacter cryoconitis]
MNLFNEITKIEFNALNELTLFKEADDRANNHYAIISDGMYGLKFSWNSEIEPVIIEVKPKVYSIGIDQHFAVVDFSSNTILLNLNLFYNFYDTKIFKEWIFIISELEILKVSRLDFNIIETYELPDFFSDIEFKGEVVEIRCSGGEIMQLKT